MVNECNSLLLDCEFCWFCSVSFSGIKLDVWLSLGLISSCDFTVVVVDSLIISSDNIASLSMFSSIPWLLFSFIIGKMFWSYGTVVMGKRVDSVLSLKLESEIRINRSLLRNQYY